MERRDGWDGPGRALILLLTPRHPLLANCSLFHSSVTGKPKTIFAGSTPVKFGNLRAMFESSSLPEVSGANLLAQRRRLLAQIKENVCTRWIGGRPSMNCTHSPKTERSCDVSVGTREACIMRARSGNWFERRDFGLRFIDTITQTACIDDNNKIQLSCAPMARSSAARQDVIRQARMARKYLRVLFAM